MTNEERYQKAANRELRGLAIEGMKTFHAKRNLLAQRSALRRDNCEILIGYGPNTILVNNCNCPREGVFAELNLLEILSACFEESAVDLLFESAGNQYQFWHNLRKILLIGANGYGSDLPMPISHRETERLLSLLRPFGDRNEVAQAQLDKRLAEAFDVDKLEPVYAAELLDIGFLLLHVPNQYDGPRHLVISPLFRKLVPGYTVTEGILQ